MDNAEGNRTESEHRAEGPGSSSSFLHRGLRSTHAHKGSSRNLGDLEVSGASRNGEAKREASDVGTARSRSAAV